MKKTVIEFLLSAITCIVLFAFAGCTDKANQIKSIIDIEYYADMQSGGDKIGVSFENGKKNGFQFTIEDKSNIDEIVNLVLTAKLTNLGNISYSTYTEFAFGLWHNHYLTIYYI